MTPPLSRWAWTKRSRPLSPTVAPLLRVAVFLCAATGALAGDTDRAVYLGDRWLLEIEGQPVMVCTRFAVPLPATWDHPFPPGDCRPEIIYREGFEP